MHQNRLWFFFLCLTVLAVVWFSGKAFYLVKEYHSLSVQTPVQVAGWEIKEGKGDHYYVVANYFFEHKGRTYHGSSSVTRPYRNPWSAQKALSGFEKKEWVVWMDPKHPKHSKIHKTFPTKTLLSTLVLVGLAIYFSVLGWIVGGRRGRRTQ